MKKLVVLSLLIASFALPLGAQVLIQDSFPYVNGILTNVSGNLWTNYSGSIDSEVANNRLQVFGNRAGDVWRPFTNSPGNPIYASFVINSTNLVATSNYLAHFSANTSTFRCRVFAGRNNSLSPNGWRLGIANAAGFVNQIFPLDLATNVDYRVVISYDTITFASTLWVDPVVSSDTSVAANDNTSAATLGFFSFRQGGNIPNVTVDDLYVANSFDEVNVGAVKPAIVYNSPTPTVQIFIGNNTNLYCVGGGAGVVSFQWQKGGANISDDANISGTTSSQLSILNATMGQAGSYRCIVTSTTNGVFQNSATSAVSVVSVSAGMVPPTINPQPTNQTVFYGQTASIVLGATGPGTITYQWKTNSTDGDIPGANSPILMIPNVAPFNGTLGTYRCAVSNEHGGSLSDPATLSATTRPTVPIAYLRTLVDPITYNATNSTDLYAAIGVITTDTNLTSGNTASYYLQDSTAGINIFLTFGSTFRPVLGDVVQFYGVLSSFSSTLELLANPQSIPGSSGVVLSNNPALLPAAAVIPFDITNNLALCETNLEGRIVMLTNIYFGESAGTVIPTTNINVLVTNAAGETFGVFFSAQVQDTVGQTLPEFAWSVIGPFTQNLPNTTFPRNQGYSVTVTRFADIITSEPPAVECAVTHSGNSSTITWTAVPYEYSYSVWAATGVSGPYTRIASGLTFPSSAGSYTDNNAGGDQKYYRVSSP